VITDYSVSNHNLLIDGADEKSEYNRCPYRRLSGRLKPGVIGGKFLKLGDADD